MRIRPLVCLPAAAVALIGLAGPAQASAIAFRQHDSVGVKGDVFACSPTDLTTGSVTAFDTRFDPNGTRLAVWVADATNPSVGKLRLVVLDHATGQIDATKNPLPDVLALKGISMDEGRLAWVTPPGQDGNQSTVQVLAWSGDDFGQVETVPGAQLTIVH